MKWLLASLGVVCFAVRGAAGEAVLEAKGYVVAAHTVQVSPTVAGVLVWVDPRLEEGQAFQQGDVLAKIDDKEYRIDADRAMHVLRAAEARLAAASDGPEEIKQAEDELDDAKANYDEREKTAQRYAALKDRAAVSEQDYDAAVSAAAAAKRTVGRCESALERVKKSQRWRQDAAEAEVGTARADLEKAKWRLDACEIRASISGTILIKAAEKGDHVNPLAFSTASSLCNMADLSDLEVELKIQETDISRISKGQTCAIMPEAYERDASFLKLHPNGYDGKVSRILPVADRSQGAIPVRVRVNLPPEEAGVYLRVDMSAVVSFQAVKKP